MPSSVHQKLMDISSLMSKMLRKNFGRGPQTCYAFANERFLVFYIRGFLSPLETILLDNGHSDHVDISRKVAMKNILIELKGILELELEQEVKSFYHDWNYLQNTGMVTVEFEQLIIQNGDRGFEVPIDFHKLIHEVERVSVLVEKMPEKTEAFYISPKVYLVKRDGILVQIEKALIEKGFEMTLMVTKDELEKSFLHRDGTFEVIFKNPVADIFVDWNFNEDDSIICFVLK